MTWAREGVADAHTRERADGGYGNCRYRDGVRGGGVTVDLHCRFKSMGITGRGEAAAVMAPMVPTMQAILMDGPYGALICHCHPSGIEAKPSQADKDTTKAFEKAFETCGVVFVDHIIVSGSIEKRSFFSFLEAGLLKS